MSKRILPLGTAFLLLTLAPASGYHIQGNYAPSASSPLTSGDWALDNSLLIACESDGPNDPRNANAVNLTGIGGLCTTGRNSVTGQDPPAAMPGPDNWTRLDICSATTIERGNDAFNGFQQNDCGGAIGSLGRTDTIGWTAEIGVYSCLVPTAGTVLDTALGALADRDYALYYDELYAWWSYDGEGTEPGYHGHVSAFPDPGERQYEPTDPTNQVLRGSAEAKAMSMSDMAAILAAVHDESTGYGDYPNNCGSSPSLTADGNQGPVIVAPSEEPAPLCVPASGPSGSPSPDTASPTDPSGPYATWLTQLLQDARETRVGDGQYRPKVHDCDDFANELELFLTAKGYDATFTVVFCPKTDWSKHQWRGHAVTDVHAPDGSLVFLNPYQAKLGAPAAKMLHDLDYDGDGQVEFERVPRNPPLAHPTDGPCRIEVYDDMVDGIQKGRPMD